MVKKNKNIVFLSQLPKNSSLQYVKTLITEDFLNKIGDKELERSQDVIAVEIVDHIIFFYTVSFGKSPKDYSVNLDKTHAVSLDIERFDNENDVIN